MSTGWTWDYIRDFIDIPRLEQLQEYWKHSPPIHLLVKGYLKYEYKEPPPVEASFDMLLASIPEKPKL